MFPLRCTVRNCSHPLVRDNRTLSCAAGHSFDQAKQGYWNLLQPQDSKSNKPGDRDEAVDARHRWTKSGVMNGLVRAINPWTVIGSPIRSAGVLDLGCGTGYFGNAIYGDLESYCGVDLSKKAIRMACRVSPSATWILANADRTLPAMDCSVGQVISLFGRRPFDLIQQVLVPNGTLIVAVPGESDLIELREKTQQTGQRRDRTHPIVSQAREHNLHLVEKHSWSEVVLLQSDQIRDALTMTYRAERHSQKARVQALNQQEVTLSADLLLFRKSE